MAKLSPTTISAGALRSAGLPGDCEDGDNPDTRAITARTTRGVRRALVDLGYASLAEFRLANRRRADVIGVDEKGGFIIVEVKVTTADFLGDSKWPNYRDFCDALYFAVPPDFPAEILPDDCGLMLADDYGAEIIRTAPQHPLHASRRKALTLKFARAAAARLMTETDPRL